MRNFHLCPFIRTLKGFPCFLKVVIYLTSNYSRIWFINKFEAYLSHDGGRQFILAYKEFYVCWTSVLNYYFLCLTILCEIYMSYKTKSSIPCRKRGSNQLPLAIFNKKFCFCCFEKIYQQWEYNIHSCIISIHIIEK